MLNASSRPLLALRGRATANSLTACRTLQNRTRQTALVSTQRRLLSSSNADPHAAAGERIKQSHGRIQGSEALQDVPNSIKMQNYAMATGLAAFVTWVWWYSMQAVGQADGNAFEAEALEAREAANRTSISQQEAQELANLDMGVSDQQDMEGVTVAVAAEDAVATKEEQDQQRGVQKSDRPLWKKIVFFWKK